MKLKVRDILKINVALRALAGQKKQVVEHGISHIIVEPAKLRGIVRSRIVRNYMMCEPFVESVREAMRGIEDQFEAEANADPIPSDKEAADFQVKLKEWQDRAAFRVKRRGEEAKRIQDEEEEIALKTISFAELNLDENQFITTEILELINPILTEVPE